MVEYLQSNTRYTARPFYPPPLLPRSETHVLTPAKSALWAHHNHTFLHAIILVFASVFNGSLFPFLLQKIRPVVQMYAKILPGTCSLCLAQPLSGDGRNPFFFFEVLPTQGRIIRPDRKGSSLLRIDTLTRKKL
jgi:hypothetical protein